MSSSNKNERCGGGVTNGHIVFYSLIDQCLTDFPIIGLMSNTFRSIQEAGIIGYGAARPTAVPEQDPSMVSRYLPTRQCISRQPCWSMSNRTRQSQTCIASDPPHACSKLALYATFQPAEPILKNALRARTRLGDWRRAVPGPRGKPLHVNVKECLKSSRFLESMYRWHMVSNTSTTLAGVRKTNASTRISRLR